MKIVIDIPIKRYNEIVYNDVETLRECIKNGVVLQEYCEDECPYCPINKEV